MQIAAEVRRVLHKSPAQVKLEDFRLKFKLSKSSSGKKLPVITKKHLAAMSKARAMMAVGFTPTATPTAIITPGSEVLRS